MLSDNRSYVHYTCGYYGRTHLPSSTCFSGSGRGRIGCTSTMESGMLVLPTTVSWHSSTLMRLHKTNPIFDMGVNDMKPALNFEPKHRVTMMTREDWTRGPGTPPAVKRLVWYTDGSKTLVAARARIYGQP